MKKRHKPKVDTVQIDIVKNDQIITDETPTESNLLPKSYKKEKYNISLLIPFKGERAMMIPSKKWTGKEKRFINFYAGVKLALNELSREGHQLDVDVYDTKKKLTEVKKLANLSNINESDVIIGPYHKESIKWLSNWSHNREITLVSPWISSTSISDNNPYYIQTKPGLLHHYEIMMYQTLFNHKGEEVYLILKEGDERKKMVMNKVLKDLGEDTEMPPYKIVELIPDSLTYGKFAFDTTFFKNPNCEKVFLVPYASSKDGGFVYDFLRKLQIEERKCEVKVYGMYKWLEFNDQMFDLINAMNVNITISNLVNPEDSMVKAFKRKYLNEYGELPTDDALEGYDLMRYIAEMLKKHGNGFQFAISENDIVQGLQTVFHLRPERDAESGKIQYYENQFLDLIHIKDFKYQRTTN